MASFSTMTVMDIVITAIGFYVIYISLWMKKNQRVHKIVLAEEEQKKCKDQKGFAAYLAIKMLIFGVVVVIAGIGGLLSDLFFKDMVWISFVILALFVVAFGLFTYFYRKGREQFVASI